MPGRQWSAADDPRPVPGSVLRIGIANARAVDRLDAARARPGERRVRAAGSRRAAGRAATLAAAKSMFDERTARAPSACPSRSVRALSRWSASRSSNRASTWWSWPAPSWAKRCWPAPSPHAEGKRPVYHVSTAALVTNLAVHFKHGRESSLVWVTALDTGEPVVAGAQVSVQDCSGKEHWKGVTDAARRGAHQPGAARSRRACPAA